MLKKVIYVLCLLILPICSHSQNVERDTVLRTTVYFDINTDNVTSGDKGYDVFLNSMLPYMYDNIISLDKVIVRGSSSPEGPEELNNRLAKQRADKITSHLYLSPERLDVKYVSENYEDLVTMVDETTRLDIIKLHIEGNIKNAIKKLTGYRQMVDTVYPKLRSVYIEMRFSYKEPCVSDTVYVIDVQRDTIYLTDTVFVKPEIRRIPIFAVKTNLVTDALLAPNVQAEVYFHKQNLSMEFEYTFPWWYDNDRFFFYQLLNGTLGVRKYLKDTYDGHWFGIYGNTNIYDLCFDKNRGVQGECWGVGISYGYAFRSKAHSRVRWEPYIRFGYLRSKFDKYHAGVPFNNKYYYDWNSSNEDFVPRRFRMNYIGPTMLGVNISFDFNKKQIIF